MVDHRAKKEEFRAGVNARDPYALAKVLNIPRVSAIQGSEPAPPKHPETLQEGGTDWSSVLNTWIGACEAAEAVSSIRSGYRGHCIFSYPIFSNDNPNPMPSSYRLLQGYAVKCYESQAALHAAFTYVFGSSTGNKLVPALHTVCKNTHRIAIAADQASVNPSDQSKLENAVTLLQESFSRTFNDRKELRPQAPYDEEGSKKAGVLLIVNELFSIYFRLNTLRLCKNLLRPVETRKLHEQGTMGQMVTYRYYTGRLNLFEDQYADAEKNLEYALKHCNKNAIHNKKCILRYLVPVKLYRGRLPSAACK
jgi:hypothetical protein